MDVNAPIRTILDVVWATSMVGRESPMSKDFILTYDGLYHCPLGRLDYKATSLPQIQPTYFELWSYTIFVGQFNFRIVQGTEMAPKIKLQTKQCFEHLLNIFDKRNFYNDKANSSILGPPSYFFEFKLVRFDFLWFKIKF